MTRPTAMLGWLLRGVALLAVLLAGCLGPNPRFDEAGETGGATDSGATGSASGTSTTGASAGSSTNTGGTGGGTGSTGGTTSGGSTGGTTTTGGPGPLDCPPAPVVCEPGLVVWRGSDTTPDSTHFDGTQFGTAAATQAVGDWRYATGAAAPTRPEAIVVAVDEASDINGMIWDGQTWTELPFNPLASGVSATFYRNHGVAYERQSGDAVVFWVNGTNGTQPLSYRTWDGSAWSAEATITTPTNGTPRQTYVSSNPTSDEVVVVANVSGSNYALVWDGDAWGGGQVLGTTATDTDLHVAHESQTGRALAIYGAGAGGDAAYRTFDGAAWSAEATLAAPASSASPRWFRLGPHGKSDRIGLAVTTADGTNGSEIWLSMWDGTAWEPAVQVTDSQVSNLNYPNAAVAFEHGTGRAIATYALDGSTTSLEARRWTTSFGWGDPLSGPTFPGNPNSITLDSDPFTNDVMLCAQDGASNLACSLWDGASFTAPHELTADSGETKNQPWVFLWSWLR